MRRALLCLLVLVSACGGGGGGPELPDLAGAEVLVARAIRDAAEAVRRAPGSGPVWGRYGEVCDVHGYPAEAALAYERAGTLAPDEWRWPYLLGSVLRMSDSQAATRQYERAAELRADYAPLAFYLGLGRLLSDDIESARRHFTRAKELDGSLLNARLGLARTELARGRPEAALTELRAAEPLAPDDAALLHHLAQALRQRGAEGDAETAAEAERRAEASAQPQRGAGFSSMADPVRDEVGRRVGTSMLWRERRSRADLQAGRSAQALAEWDEVLAVEPRSLTALVESARVLAGSGRMEAARQRLERAVDLAPDDGPIRAELATLLNASGARAEALATMRRAHELAPQDPNILNNLAGLLFAAGETDAGLDMMRAACEALPQNADVRYNLAVALDRTGHGAEALPVLRRALLIDRRHGPARMLLGTLHARAGNLEEAALSFLRVVEDHPDQAEPRVRRGRALRALGRDAEAVEAFRAGLARSPGQASIEFELAWLLATSATARAPAEAVALATGLVEATGRRDPRALDTLGAAQAARGDFESARVSVGEAIDLLVKIRDRARAAGAAGEVAKVEALIAALEGRRSSYQVRQPYTEHP